MADVSAGCDRLLERSAALPGIAVALATAALSALLSLRSHDLAEQADVCHSH
ncbi:MAG: hypothetical protein AAGI71_18970 [Bacteroidota bacterium]